MRNTFQHFILLGLLTLVVAGCQAPDGDIYILYENDVHCAVDGYEKMAALRADYLKKSIYVNVVSCGDFVQGDKAGSISKGRYPVALMNAVPYDYVALGNHEFDYGMPQLRKLMWWMRAKVLCCNFSYVSTGKQLYRAYHVRSYGSRKVAFIGVATPESLTSSVPTNFQNEDGEWEYSFHADEVAELVQQAVNSAKEEGAEYVIVLSHLGDDTRGINSVDLIHQTEGIDVVLDGHAHHVINRKLADLNGDSVLLASTGCKFQYIGRLLIDLQGKVSNELINMETYQGTNPRMRSRINNIKEKVSEKTNKLIGFSQIKLTDSDDNNNRLVRYQETNLCNFVADAMRVVTKADIGISNAGGIRGSLPAGQLTYGDLMQVLPFNNSIYQIRLTGKQMVNALEIGARALPKESGDLLHTSGLRYTINATIPTSVHLDENGMCDSIGVTRRVSGVEVEKDGVWMPIDTNAVYTVGGQNYMLVCGGGSGMFNGTEEVPTEHMPDVDALVKYIQILGDTIRANQYGMTQQRLKINN